MSVSPVRSFATFYFLAPRANAVPDMRKEGRERTKSLSLWQQCMAAAAWLPASPAVEATNAPCLPIAAKVLARPLFCG